MNEGGAPGQSIPAERLGRFLGLLAHDMRNRLGAIDLQAALLSELSADQELTEEIQTLRSLVGESVEAIQSLTTQVRLPEVHLGAYPVADLLEAFRECLKEKLGCEEFRWEVEVGGGWVEVDLNLILGAWLELSQNAVFFRAEAEAVRIGVRREDGRLLLQWSQRGSTGQGAPETWGREILLTSRRKGYGLGLFHAREVLDAHHATLDFSEREGTVYTEVRLPLLAPSEEPGPGNCGEG